MLGYWHDSLWSLLNNRSSVLWVSRTSEASVGQWYGSIGRIWMVFTNNLRHVRSDIHAGNTWPTSATTYKDYLDHVTPLTKQERKHNERDKYMRVTSERGYK